MKPFERDLADLERAGQRRVLRPLSSPQGREVRLGGQTLLNFSSNDYLGLASHPEVVRAAHDALDRFGHGAGAARLLAGNFDLSHRLEARLVDWLGGERALLFSSGYHANLAVLPTLYREGLVHSDALNHASLIDGIRLSGAPKEIYPHLQPPSVVDPEDWLVTESLFSMNGDSPDVAGLEHIISSGRLILDEAHSFGVRGDGGRGLGHHSSIRVGTFGKALGGFGAFVLGPAPVAELLISRARTFMFTTALPASVLAANLAGVELASGSHGDEARDRLATLSARLTARLPDAVIGTGPIFSIVLGAESTTMAVSLELERRGLLVQPIRPPTVPTNTSRLRIVVTAEHRADDIDKLADALDDAVRHVDVLENIV